MSTFTRQAIMDAFLRLLLKKPFRKITVRDIVEECGVNRTTFYYYYQDIYAIVEDIADMALAAFAAALSGRMCEEDVRDALAFAEMHRRSLLSLWEALGQEAVRHYVYASTDTAVKDFVKREAEGLSLPEGDMKMAFLLVREFLFGALHLYLSGEMPEGQGKSFLTMTAGTVRGMLENLSKKNDA